MTPDLMSPYATDNEHRARFEEQFRNDPKRALWTLVVRAIHRHINDAVFRTFDLQSTPQTDQNCLSVGVEGNVLSKKEMSKKFIHNSQRGFWDARVSRWAVVVAAPAAQNAILVALRAA